MEIYFLSFDHKFSASIIDRLDKKSQDPIVRYLERRAQILQTFNWTNIRVLYLCNSENIVARLFT